LDRILKMKDLKVAMADFTSGDSTLYDAGSTALDGFSDDEVLENSNVALTESGGPWLPGLESIKAGLQQKQRAESIDSDGDSPSAISHSMFIVQEYGKDNSRSRRLKKRAAKMNNLTTTREFNLWR